jgi:glycosyltransferase involved in cell wall biosynthesis
VCNVRVAYVCMDAGVPVFGTKGCSVHVQEVVRGLIQRGADVELYATREGSHRPDDLADLRTHWFATPRDQPQGQREQAALANNVLLHDALVRRGPFDLVYERYSLWSFAAMEYARRMGIPGLLEVNAPLIAEHTMTRRLLDAEAAERVADRVFAAAHALLPVSTQVATYLAQFPGASGRVHVVRNGVNVERVHPGIPAARSRRPGELTIGFVGTLKPWHGLETLVEAFARLHRAAPETRLLIVGTGPEEERLVRQLEQFDILQAVHLTGGVAPSEIPALLTSMDIAVAPAPPLADFYFSPLKLFEYMAAALPVVAARIGQIAEVIHDGVDGLLFAPGDAAALSASLDRLRRDPVLRTRIGAAARETIRRSHSWNHTIDRILRLAGVTATAA